MKANNLSAVRVNIIANAQKLSSGKHCDSQKRLRWLLEERGTWVEWENGKVSEQDQFRGEKKLAQTEEIEIEKQTVRSNKRIYKNSSGVLIWWRYEVARALLKSSCRDNETNKHFKSVHITQMWRDYRHYKVKCQSGCTYKAAQVLGTPSPPLWKWICVSHTDALLAFVGRERTKPIRVKQICCPSTHKSSPSNKSYECNRFLCSSTSIYDHIFLGSKLRH